MRVDEFFDCKLSRYIIAEISQNHDGSLGQAHAFIDAVAKTGADAIKFQTHIAEEESTLEEPFRVAFSYCDKTRYEYWKRMEFSKEQWSGLFSHALDAGLDFLSSPFSIKALEMLDDIGVPAWKFGSGEVFNTPLLNAALSTGKPIIISNGLSTMEDTHRVVAAIKRHHNRYAVLECTTAYPSEAKSIPILNVVELKRLFCCPVGISDHSATLYPSLASTALGGSLVEVHVTMSREMFGPDVGASVTTSELGQIVEGVDFIQEMLASEVDKDRLDPERMNLRNMFSKSLYAKRDISAGTILQANDIAIKKPFDETGFPADFYSALIGKVAVADIKCDEPFKSINVE